MVKKSLYLLCLVFVFGCSSQVKKSPDFHRPQRLSVLVDRLSQDSGQKLSVQAPLGNVVVAVESRGSSVDEILQELAIAVQAEWVTNAGGKVLVPSVALELEARKELVAKYGANLEIRRDYLSKNIVPLDGQFFAATQEKIEKRREVELNFEPEPDFAAEILRADLMRPEVHLLAKTLQLLPLDQVAGLRASEEVVFSTDPVGRQKQLDPAILDFWKTLEPARRETGFDPVDLAKAPITKITVAASKRQSDTQNLTVTFHSGPQYWSHSFDPLIGTPETEIAGGAGLKIGKFRDLVSRSAEELSFIRTIHGAEKPSNESREMLINPVKHEPLDIILGPSLLNAPNEQSSARIFVIPDYFGSEELVEVDGIVLGGQDLKPWAYMSGGMFQTVNRGKWVHYRPIGGVDPSQWLDRYELAETYRKLNSKDFNIAVAGSSIFTRSSFGTYSQSVHAQILRTLAPSIGNRSLTDDEVRGAGRTIFAHLPANVVRSLNQRGSQVTLPQSEWSEELRNGVLQFMELNRFSQFFPGGPMSESVVRDLHPDVAYPTGLLPEAKLDFRTVLRPVENGGPGGQSKVVEVVLHLEPGIMIQASMPNYTFEELQRLPKF